MSPAALVEFDELADRPRGAAPDHRHDWQAAGESALAAGSCVGRRHGGPTRPRARRRSRDLDGPHVLSRRLHSAAELIDHAADLCSHSAGLVHDNERRWRVFRRAVAGLGSLLEAPVLRSMASSMRRPTRRPTRPDPRPVISRVRMLRHPRGSGSMWCPPVMVIGPTFVHHSNRWPGSKRLTVHTAGRWRGWVIRARLPRAIGPSSSSTTSVMVGVSSGQPLDVDGEGPDHVRSTSASIEQVVSRTWPDDVRSVMLRRPRPFGTSVKDRPLEPAVSNRSPGGAVPSARDALLEKAMAHVAEHGLTDLSLRELAAGVGTSHRMLSTTSAAGGPASPPSSRRWRRSSARRSPRWPTAASTPRQVIEAAVGAAHRPGPAALRRPLLRGAGHGGAPPARHRRVPRPAHRAVDRGSPPTWRGGWTWSPTSTSSAWVWRSAVACSSRCWPRATWRGRPRSLRRFLDLWEAGGSTS